MQVNGSNMILPAVIQRILTMLFSLDMQLSVFVATIIVGIYHFFLVCLVWMDEHHTYVENQQALVYSLLKVSTLLISICS
jgi:hypothetical protein